MSVNARNRLVLFGALWGLALVMLPAVLLFDGFALSPFLVAALLLSALSGAAGAVVAGRRAGHRRVGRGWADALKVGALQGTVAAVLAGLSVWLALTATMTGFSPAAPARILTLFTEPSIFLHSALAAAVSFAYAASAGLLFSPIVGSAILRLAEGRPSRRPVREAG